MRLIPLLCAIALFAAPIAASAQFDAVSDLLNRINALRRQNGLAPLELNDALSAAAQRHSQDMANTGNVDHTRSDGSTPEQRSYAPRHTWGENIYGGGIATVDDAWTFWTGSTVHRNNLLNEHHREVGIGAAAGANGTYYTLTFGARPGVLPFFVDQGSVVGSPAVTLTLSNEEAEPAGSGGTMGRAVEIRVGEGEDLSAVAWQPWQRTIQFALSSVDGEHRIYVEYRDANGAVASYFRLVTLTGAAAPSTATPTTIPTVQPTSTHTATPASTDTPTVVPTDTPAPSATPTATPLPSPTSTPAPPRPPPPPPPPPAPPPPAPPATKTPAIVALRSDRTATDTAPSAAAVT